MTDNKPLRRPSQPGESPDHFRDATKKVEDDPNRDGPARPMPTETFSEDEPERDGDDVLRETVKNLEARHPNGFPEHYWFDHAFAVLAKRALEGK